MKRFKRAPPCHKQETRNRIIALFARRHDAGQPMPNNQDIAEVTGLRIGQVAGLVYRLVLEGLVPSRQAGTRNGLPVSRDVLQRRARKANKPPPVYFTAKPKPAPVRRIPAPVRAPLPDGMIHKTCQYIAGQPTRADSCKCGRRVAPGSSYCAEHHALCWSKLRTERAVA